MGEFHDHPRKKIIREYWCKPLLEYINKSLGYKLIYLGLPGLEALDVLAWIDYLEKVIAFECGDYSKSKDKHLIKKNLDLLNDILSSFERQGLLKTYSLYNGYIEKVVLRGRDENGDEFRLEDLVTVYNLDFCNPLTVPMEIADDAGNIKKCYKTEVICKLLEKQRDIAKGKNNKNKFIMFLTVHSKFWENEAEKIIPDNEYSSLNIYKKQLSGLSNEDRILRLLRLYVVKVIKDHFLTREFIPDFLPPIYYEGFGQHRLLCFTIIGTHQGSSSSFATCFQNIDNFLKSSFLTVTEDKIDNFNCKNISEIENLTDPVELIKNLETIKQIWTIN
jgi:hypothetical protein